MSGEEYTLIVYVSTGGIIALGLGVKQWSVNHCVTEFIRLCDQAFTPREFNSVAGLQQVATLSHGSKYKTTPLRNALKATFGTELLYGGQREAHTAYDIQVAVTATSATGEQSLLLANYSRPQENDPSYKFAFPHNLSIWEAASATSAAPSFFKPFTSWPAGDTYLDGALYFNNPVRVSYHERKFLWPDVAESSPDILLSIGTGKNGQHVGERQVELASSIINRRVQGRRMRTWYGKSKLTSQPASAKNQSSGLISKFFSVLVRYILCQLTPGLL